MKAIVKFFILVFVAGTVQAQQSGWHLLEADPESSIGISAHGLYDDILKNKPSETVVVAIIDSGVDVEHEDLRENIWVNHDEIPGNGIDDDNNGYIDDIHGWNFIGGPDGNVHHDTYEATRIYAALKYKFDNADPEKLSKKDKKQYDLYLECKTEVEKKLESAKNSLENIQKTEDIYMSSLDAIKEALNGNAITLENLKKIDGMENRQLGIGKNILLDMLAQGYEPTSVDSIKLFFTEGIREEKEYYENKVLYAYNTEFNPRTIVGDNYSDPYERYYGNNDVEGPDAMHGTHVAGIVGAVRGNDVGMDGVARNVRIMSVRAVPDGDERDKDVANAIRYAVDNGASIINMSFGKGYSWNEEVVEDAIEYAEDRDVLLVHAAGNDGKNNDESNNYPNDSYKGKGFLFFKGKEKNYKNWIEVGALSYMNDTSLPASFSNYGAKEVDIFAPGVEIYSTIPDDGYRALPGTSMAAPIVSGVAAVLRSYFPALTAEQVKEILMESATVINIDVHKPGSKDELVPFSELCVSQGVVNAEKAVRKAMQTEGKKKIKKQPSRPDRA